MSAAIGLNGSTMSIRFSVSDLITIGRLLMKLTDDYASAPAEGRELAEDLKMLQDCLENLGTSCSHFGPEDNERLATRLAPVREILEEMEKLREKFSSLMDTEERPRVWDRLRFPKLQIQAIRKRISLHISTLNLFVGARSTTSLANIETYLKEMARNNPGVPRLGDDESWNTMLPELQRRGMALDSAERCRTYIEEHLVALSEVEVAESQLLDNFEGSIVPDDALDQEIIVGGPTPAHTFSCLCPGAIALQKGDFTAIKESKGLLYRHFGGHKYEISCKFCKFHGFQDEPLKLIKGELNTPLLFCSRKEALKPDCAEYYLPSHKNNQGKPDGVFYHTLFFWKSHTPENSPTKHDAGAYECVFCPPSVSYGCLMDRKTLINHIRRRHVQKLPDKALREKFNVYVDTQTALFKDDEGRCSGKKFDILLPRALGRTDIIRAEQAMREAEETRKEVEKKEAEEKKLAEKAQQEKEEKKRQATMQVQRHITPSYGGFGFGTQYADHPVPGQQALPAPYAALPPSTQPAGLLLPPPGHDASPLRGILKNSEERMVRFQDEAGRPTQPFDGPSLQEDARQVAAPKPQPVLNLVHTRYTSTSRGGEREAPRPRPKIIEVLPSDEERATAQDAMIMAKMSEIEALMRERDERRKREIAKKPSQIIDSAIDVTMGV